MIIKICTNKTKILNPNFLDVFFPICNSVINGLIIGVLGNMLSSTEKYADFIYNRNLWFLIALFPITAIIDINIRKKKNIGIQQNYLKEIERIKEDNQLKMQFKQEILQKNYDILLSEVFYNILKVVVESLSYPKKDISINVYLLNVEIENNKEVLCLEKGYTYEKDWIVGKHYLKQIVPRENPELVISKAYLENCPFYKVLTTEDEMSYKENIKDKIDPDLKWVFASPIQFSNIDKPMGIMCFNGKTNLIKNKQEKQYFLKILESVCEVITQFKQFESILNINSAQQDKNLLDSKT